MAIFEHEGITYNVQWNGQQCEVEEIPRLGPMALVVIPQALAPQVGAELWPEVVAGLQHLARGGGQRAEVLRELAWMAGYGPGDGLSRAMGIIKEMAEQAQALLATLAPEEG